MSRTHVMTAQTANTTVEVTRDGPSPTTALLSAKFTVDGGTANLTLRETETNHAMNTTAISANGTALVEFTMPGSVEIDLAIDSGTVTIDSCILEQ